MSAMPTRQRRSQLSRPDNDDVSYPDSTTTKRIIYTISSKGDKPDIRLNMPMHALCKEELLSVTSLKNFDPRVKLGSV
ncbi:hypothetical protein F2Q69_00014751 [Brassica cretica]|uniref:Uncharacterized protein n=1 Tax=Brassica cretica TaxID=69181 RepID=A0A8S9QZX3_BRACR|nr:hypothetical protein F2Q69_00014751 [Brassica cretica]